MISPPVQLDPLSSPHPVPWGWVTSMLSERSAAPRVRHYRSQSLLSPDGRYAAYSRIKMKLARDFTQSRISSILFLENLQTGSLQNIAASSPFADNPFAADLFSAQGAETVADQPGMVAMLIPVSWSETGDRLLVREFESFLGSDIASDFGVVWEQRSDQVRTIAPTEVQYSNAVLLGWSQRYPDRVLFRASMMGDRDGSLYAVNTAGHTLLAIGDRPLTFGRRVNSVWAGPQVGKR